MAPRLLARLACGVVLLGLVSGTAARASAQAPSLTVEAYCALAYDALGVAATAWADRVSAAEQIKDPKERAKRLEAIGAQFVQANRTLHADHGLTPEGALHYAATHGETIAEYLEVHEDARSAIEARRREVEGLIERFEALVNPNGGQP